MVSIASSTLFKNLLKATPNKIIAVGKNFQEHVQEMGDAKAPENPVIFQKPLTSLVAPGQPVILPKIGSDIHHELEVTIMLSKSFPIGTFNPDAPVDYIGGYCLALDITDRPLQTFFKQKGFPWDLSKGMDCFCPVSELVDSEKISDIQDLEFVLKRDDQILQKEKSLNMIFSLQKILAYTNQFVSLTAGDLILTGSPKGVGSISRGETLKGELYNKGELILEHFWKIE